MIANEENALLDSFTEDELITIGDAINSAPTTAVQAAQCL